MATNTTDIPTQASPGFSTPEAFTPLLSSSHPALIIYSSAIGVIVFTVLLVVALVLVIKIRKRRHESAVDTDIVAFLRRERTLREGMAEKKNTNVNLPRRPEVARVRPFNANIHRNIPDIVVHNAVEFSNSFSRQTVIDDVDRLARSRADDTSRYHPWPDARLYGQPDENAHREISVRVPPSPPLGTYMYEWELMHGGQTQPFRSKPGTRHSIESDGTPDSACETFHDAVTFSDNAGITVLRAEMMTDSAENRDTGSKAAPLDTYLSPVLKTLLLESPRVPGGTRHRPAEADLANAHAWLADDDWLYDSRIGLDAGALEGNDVDARCHESSETKIPPDRLEDYAGGLGGNEIDDLS